MKVPFFLAALVCGVGAAYCYSYLPSAPAGKEKGWWTSRAGQVGFGLLVVALALSVAAAICETMP